MATNKTRRLADYALWSRNFLLDLVFPLECLGCGEPETWLCPRCFRSLPLNNRLFCPACGQNNESAAYCRNCAPDFFLDGIWSAGSYQDKLAAKLIKKYKYHFIKDLSGILSRLLIIYFVQLLESYRLGQDWSQTTEAVLQKQLKTPLPMLWLENTLVISVPLHEKRRRWRGFNQAELIAADFCRYFGLDFDPKVLVRTKYTKPQMKLKKDERLQNLRGAFAVRGGDLGRRPVILVDDVATTGSTLNECARVLKQNGASEVWGLVLARG